jgi:deoxyribodipyrimidine photo-lyase
MGGVHDRGWPERAVFGKIRSMTFNGAKSKFRVQEYIDAQERGSLL